MSEVRALIEQLVAAGVDPIEAAEVVTRAALHGAASTPKARSAGAIRQERYRRNKASQVTECDASNATPDKEGPHTPKEINPSPKKPPTGSKKGSPRSELEAVLDAERAEAVIDHRQRLRKPLTAHAARLLAQQLARCPNPNAAADLMIERGWQSIKPEWAENAGIAAAPKPATPDEIERHNREAAEREAYWLARIAEDQADGSAEGSPGIGVGEGVSDADAGELGQGEGGELQSRAVGEQRGRVRSVQGPDDNDIRRRCEDATDGGQPAMGRMVPLPPGGGAQELRVRGALQPVSRSVGAVLACASGVSPDWEQ